LHSGAVRHIDANAKLTPASWRRHSQVTGLTATRLVRGYADRRSSLPNWSTSRRPRSLAASCWLGISMPAGLGSLWPILPMRRAPHRPLLPRCWELRQNVTVCDAAYVALAERLDIVLLTADARLANATGSRCQFDLL